MTRPGGRGWRARNQRARDRLMPIVRELAAATNVPTPVLEVTFWRGPSMGPSTPHGRVLSYPARAALQRTELQLRGTIAHELQHAAHQDVDGKSLPARKLLPPAVTAGLFLLLAVGVAVWVRVTQGIGVLQSPKLFSLVMVLMLGCAAALLNLMDRYARRRSDGLAQPLVELWADIAASRVVGRDASLAGLRELNRREAALPHRVRKWVERRILRVTPTHPAATLRISAVESDDGADDALTVAARALKQDLAPEKRS